MESYPFLTLESSSGSNASSLFSFAWFARSYRIINIVYLTLTVNSRELDLLLIISVVEEEDRNPPLTSILIPVRLWPDLFNLAISHRDLHDIVRELKILVKFSYCFEQVLLAKLIFSLQVLNFHLGMFVLLPEFAYYVSHVINFLLQVLILLLNQEHLFLFPALLLLELLLFLFLQT